ncbi:DUF4148 domain-containing protein [Curtobacterium sp. MCSS17_015]|uniref:DUF4148 domain-containing protein n=1 Tax=Curtobacterium sp. MCSS17_015 TaxID=2175666 RepID=UPI0011B35EE2|nr:DUF4148 domain-containing protein [Curtobacterium sp. MCSS17_015]WIB27265.1 DUF4148 domain-containing protein [Curtobacterium sp. MCSS17_015]
MKTELRAIVVAALTLGLTVSCAAGGTPMPKDAAGLTRADVAELSLHQEFDRYREHYEEMQRVLAAAQRAVHQGEWDWNGGDDNPGIGGDGRTPLPGADVDNSYFLESSRAWTPEGATGSRTDLDPMIDYFAQRGWDTHVERVADTYYLDGTAHDGWHVEYFIQPSGRYSLTVSSDLFWTNNADALSRAVFGRAPLRWPDRSSPGEYPKPPEWDTPIINRPTI